MPMHLISTQKTFKQVDAKGRNQFLLKLDVANVEKMIAALTELKGGEVALDVRTSEKEAKNGGTFESSFIMVRDYLPKQGEATAGAATGVGKQFVPKAKTVSAAAASQVNRVKATVA